MKNKKVLWAAIAIVLVAAIMAGAYFILTPKGQAGQKKLTVVIKGAGDAVKNITMQTDSEYLRGALDQYSLISGVDFNGELFVTTVDGYTADDSKQEWWCFTKGGETMMTGVDITPIADGESYEITLMTGY